MLTEGERDYEYARSYVVSALSRGDRSLPDVDTLAKIVAKVVYATCIVYSEKGESDA